MTKICGYKTYPTNKPACKKEATYEAIGMFQHLGYRCEYHKNAFISMVELIPLVKEIKA